MSPAHALILTNDFERLEFHFYIDSQATSLVQLAQSLVIDLKLDKCPTAIRLPPRSLLKDAWESFKPPLAKQRTEQSPDDKRALLGVYHTSAL